MSGNKALERDKVLTDRDKDSSVSDTAYFSGALREAFPTHRHGGAKGAIYAAYRHIAPQLSKQFTERRARSIWEGSARRIDAEEAFAIRRAQEQELRREYRELQSRLASLGEALAVADQAVAREALAARRPLANGVGQVDRAGTE